MAVVRPEGPKGTETGIAGIDYIAASLKQKRSLGGRVRGFLDSLLSNAGARLDRHIQDAAEDRDFIERTLGY